MVEKEFGEEAEVPAVRLLLATVDFEKGNAVLVVAIDFVAGRMAQSTFLAMTHELGAANQKIVRQNSHIRTMPD